MLCSLDSTPDIVTITETRLSCNSISNLDIPKYNVFHTDSPTPAGGAAIYVNKDLKAIPRPDLKIDLPLVESCWVEIDPNNNRKHIMIGCIYKHPPANVEEFTVKFDEFLNKLNPSKYDMYIMGDVNIGLLKYHSHQQTGRYLDMIYSLDLLPVITKPTRITNHTVTLIDLIYTNNVNRLTSGIVTVDISDHLPVFCMVDTPLKKQNRQNTYLTACLHEGGGPQVGVVTWGGLPHLTCKRDHIKMRDYMDRRVTPPKRVTSPIWGTPPPCKQALRDYSKFNTESYLHDIHTIDWNEITEQCNHCSTLTF